MVEALATAMALNRTVARREWASAPEAVAAARQAVAVLPVSRRARAVVLQVVRWVAERGDVLPAEMFHAVIVALGLSDGRGSLRQRVRESVTPSPKPEIRLAGLIVNGEQFPWSRWPSDENDAGPIFEADIDDVEFLRRERPAESRVGMRKPDQFKAAVELEERKRLDFATEEDEDGELDWGSEDPTRQETPHRLLARDLTASPNTIRALVASTAYQMIVYSGVFWRSKLSRQWRWRRDDR